MTIIGDIAGKGSYAAIRAFNRLEWTMLALGSAACGLICVGTGALLGIPRNAHFDGSLLLGGAPTIGVIAALLAIVVTMAIGSLIASYVEREAGLFCCCIGLAAFAVRCGSMRPVLQYASNQSVFLSLAGEVVILGSILIGGWIAFRLLLDRVVLKRDRSINHAAANEITDATLQQKLTTLAVQMVTMAVLEMIFIQTDAKAQATAGVFVAGYAGAIAAYFYTALAEGIWIWAGPIGVALIGYLLAYFNADDALTGDLKGMASALARATPLDYAGMGVAGALMGYWTSRRWAQPDLSGDEETAPAE